MSNQPPQLQLNGIYRGKPWSGALPRGLVGFIWRVSAWDQLWLSLLSIIVFVLSTAPLELQRRIVNDAFAHGALREILWLSAAYAGVALAEGAVKLLLNIYRGWTSENAVRMLRFAIHALINQLPGQGRDTALEGVEVSLILAETEPVGGFVGTSLSEPVLQGGVLLAVFGYMVYLQPLMALLCFLLFAPQLVIVPLMQAAINRRAQSRIRVLRAVSGALLDDNHREPGPAASQRGRIGQVFTLNMGIYKLKFSMNFLMNLLHHLGIAGVLALGGYYVVEGSIELGTVVAFLAGLAKINDPWGELVNWSRDAMVTHVKYRLIADAVAGLERSVQTAPAAAAG